MSEKINITIVGAAGKMGCELIRQISNSSKYNLVAAIEGKDSKFIGEDAYKNAGCSITCLLYTSPSPRDISGSRMPSSA